MEAKALLESGQTLPLMEEFYSLQGEGYHSGTAAYFLRIGGCDVGCYWCDVKESWNAALHSVTRVDVMVKNAQQYARTVVVTGGEPLQWNMEYLTSELHKNKIKTHLETSGSDALSGHWDWICLSPKKNKLPLEAIYPKADELKIIIRSKQDLLFAEKQAKKISKNCQLFLQPEWSVRQKMMPVITEYILKNPQWKISIQLHKYLNIP